MDSVKQEQRLSPDRLKRRNTRSVNFSIFIHPRQPRLNFLPHLAITPKTISQAINRSCHMLNPEDAFQ